MNARWLESFCDLIILLTLPCGEMVGRGPYAKPDFKTKVKIMNMYRDGLKKKETAKTGRFPCEQLGHRFSIQTNM